MTPAVVFLLHTHVMHWKDPFNCSLDPLLTGYRIGLRTGQYDHALACANSYAVCAYNSGYELSVLERDLNAFGSQALAYRQHFALDAMAAIRQMALNLMGGNTSNTASRPLILTGDAMDQTQALKDAQRQRNHYTISVILRARLELAYLLNSTHLEVLLEDFEETVEGGGVGVVGAVGSVGVGGSSVSHAGSIRQVFLVGLCYLRLSRLGPKYRRRAKQQMTLLEKYYKTDGNHNCYHMYLLMKAEWYTQLKLNPMLGDCLELYNDAIQAAARGGYTHDEAIATERAADVCAMMCQWNAAEAYYTECYRLYRQWGATVKLQQLQSLHHARTMDKRHVSKAPSAGSNSTAQSLSSMEMPASMYAAAAQEYHLQQPQRSSPASPPPFLSRAPSFTSPRQRAPRRHSSGQLSEASHGSNGLSLRRRGSHQHPANHSSKSTTTRRRRRSSFGSTQRKAIQNRIDKMLMPDGGGGNSHNYNFRRSMGGVDYF
eukprot:CAMPEP_0116546054 /NCGR_PEP_ID=MMETSP0397-20121206/3015_1 /TAXON_ID=216820 /ORGANISM="Cyclophora tenuis, Strain ECT3854" /LENGTH=486 /DNA_ID=CAMNT_0004070445 /DNA_START=57 /DNA_END=1517 /DNA_ORIENTATION=+